MFDYRPIGSNCTAETQYVVCICPVVLAHYMQAWALLSVNTTSGILMLVSHGVIILHATSHTCKLKQSYNWSQVFVQKPIHLQKCGFIIQFTAGL